MGRKEKLLARIRQSPRQVRFEEIERAMQSGGFEERHAGSHYVYSHAQLSGVVTIVKPHGKGGTQFVAPIYIKKALLALQQVEGLTHE